MSKRCKPLVRAGRGAVAALASARRMPRARHFVGRERGEPFDEQRSEVLAWLTRQAAIRNWLLWAMSRTGAIVFDKERSEWRGRDTP